MSDSPGASMRYCRLSSVVIHTRPWSGSNNRTLLLTESVIYGLTGIRLSLFQCCCTSTMAASSSARVNSSARAVASSLVRTRGETRTDNRCPTMRASRVWKSVGAGDAETGDVLPPGPDDAPLLAPTLDRRHPVITGMLAVPRAVRAVRVRKERRLLRAGWRVGGCGSVGVAGVAVMRGLPSVRSDGCADAVRNRTDFEPEVDRSRCGLRPISTMRGSAVPAGLRRRSQAVVVGMLVRRKA